MRVRALFRALIAMTVILAVLPLGCGGAQEDYVVVSQPSVPTNARARPQVEVPAATVRQLKACVDQRAGQWPERSYALQYAVKANDRGNVLQIELRDTTLHDAEVEGCLRRALAAMPVPEEALRLRSSRPFSGGERMMRERRGPFGSSNSENPILVPIIVEAIGVDVIIEVLVGVVAAIGTIVSPKKKDPDDECQRHYDDCLLTHLGGRGGGSVHGESRCLWCRSACVGNGGNWPSRALGVRNRWVSCEYWRK